MYNSNYVTPKHFIEDVIAKACNNDERIKQAFADIPRAIFVASGMQQKAYGDFALPIGFGQTISQPSTVAHMLDLLDLSPDDKVLEIGFGSGFVTALLSRLVSDVYAIEYIPALFEQTRALIRQLRLRNVMLKQGDGGNGWAEFAPYDKIIASAGANNVPKKLIEQLKDGGIMVIPVQDKLLRCIKVDGELKIEKGKSVSFVDFVGS